MHQNLTRNAPSSTISASVIPDDPFDVYICRNVKVYHLKVNNGGFVITKFYIRYA